MLTSRCWTGVSLKDAHSTSFFQAKDTLFRIPKKWFDHSGIGLDGILQTDGRAEAHDDDDTELESVRTLFSDEERDAGFSIEPVTLKDVSSIVFEAFLTLLSPQSVQTTSLPY